MIAKVAPIILDTNDIVLVSCGEEKLKKQIKLLRYNKPITSIRHGVYGANCLKDWLLRDIISGLNYNPHVNTLDICILSKQEIYKKFFCLLEGNTSITSLRAYPAFSGDEPIKYLARTLHTNIKITDLKLIGNNISFLGFDHIMKSLTSNTTITFLSLFACKIEAQQLKSLTNFLSTNSTLINLDLSSTHIKFTNQTVVNKLINSALKTLDLRDNKIGNEGATMIANILRINSTLSELHLPGNEIGDAGFKVLMKALYCNTSLTSLTLFNNPITIEGVKILNEYVHHGNKTAITDLNLNCISIMHHPGFEEIVKGIAKQNPNFKIKGTRYY